MVNAILILVVALIVLIWLSHEIKKVKHKVIAVFLILLLVFTYFSFSSVIKGKDLDLKTMDGMKEAGRLYVLWLGHAFKNVKTATGNIINMDWKINESAEPNLSLNKEKKPLE